MDTGQKRRAADEYGEKAAAGIKKRGRRKNSLISRG